MDDDDLENAAIAVSVGVKTVGGYVGYFKGAAAGATFAAPLAPIPVLGPLAVVGAALVGGLAGGALGATLPGVVLNNVFNPKP